MKININFFNLIILKNDTQQKILIKALEQHHMFKPKSISWTIKTYKKVNKEYQFVLIKLNIVII